MAVSAFLAACIHACLFPTPHLLSCTAHTALQSAWEEMLRQPLASVSMKHDGSMVAVGTCAGKVLVHDTRRISTTLATQEFSDELPVTALRWQHQTPNKSHKSRPSTGGAAAASSAPRISAAAPAGKPPGSVLSTAAGAAGAKGHSASAAAAAAPAAPPVAGVGSAAAGASAAAPAQPRAPLVVPGWDSGVKSAASVDSCDAVSEQPHPALHHKHIVLGANVYQNIRLCAMGITTAFTNATLNQPLPPRAAFTHSKQTVQYSSQQQQSGTSQQLPEQLPVDLADMPAACPPAWPC